MLFEKFLGRRATAPRTITFSAPWPSAALVQVAELRDARILLTDVEPIRGQDVLALKQALGAIANPLVFVAPAFEPDSLPVMARLNIVPVCAGDVGVQCRDDLLADLAVLTRGRVLATALGAGLSVPGDPGKGPAGLILPGLGWSDVRSDDLGRADVVTVGGEILTVETERNTYVDAHLNSLLGQFRYALNDVERESFARRFERFGRSPQSGPPPKDGLKIPPNALPLPGGFASAFFVTDPEHGWADQTKVRVLVADLDLTSVDELVGVATAMRQQGTPLMVAARSVKGAALAFLVVNKLRGMLPVVAIHIPAPTEQAGNLFWKLAEVTGSTLQRTSAQLATAGEVQLGRAARVVSGRNWTVVMP